MSVFVEPLFILGNLVVLPIWVLMIFVPRWSWSERVVASMLSVLLVAAIYVLTLFVALATPLPAGDSTLNLTGLTRFLETPAWAAAAWLHLLTFDLFVGRWVYLDSRKHNINSWLLPAILALTFVAGPLGLLGYTLFCLVRRRSAGL